MNEPVISKIADLASSDLSILLGAGASAALGLPTMFNFLRDAYGEEFIDNFQKCERYSPGTQDIREVNSNKATMRKRLFHSVALMKGRVSYDLEDVFQFIHETRLLQGNLEAVRHLFWMFKVCQDGHAWNFDTYKSQSDSNKSQMDVWLSDFRTTINDLRSLMHQRFLIKSNNSKVVNKANEVYSILKELFPSSDATIFTTNFDTVFEALQQSSKLDWTLVDGFEQSRNPGFKWMNFCNKNSNRKLFYFKLHGSVTWERDETDLRDCYPQVPSSVALLEPVISKSPDGFPFLGMYEIFESILLKNKICCAIGFSFRDDKIRNLVIQRLQNSLPFHLIILAPDDKTTEGANTYLEELEMYSNVTRIKEYFGTPEANAELLRVVRHTEVLNNL